MEVLIDQNPSPEFRASWLTFDPTPADQRNESVARVGGIIGNFRQITDLVRYVWVFYIVGFNAERQERFLYAPIRALIGHAFRGFAIIGDVLRGWLHFPSVESFFSFQGFVVSFMALTLVAGLIWASVRFGRLLRGLSRSDRAGSASQAVGNLFFRRLLQLLDASGVKRLTTETPREFARRAAEFLSRPGIGSEIVADVPPLVVDAFYRIRFGNHELTPTDYHHLVARLDALEARLTQPQGSPT